MHCRYLFLLGRAGCGKSALYRELETRLLDSGRVGSCERVDDFPKLWARIEADDAREREGKERLHSGFTEEGDYVLTDFGVLDEILREVNADLLETDTPDHLVVVEFARPNYVEALQAFDPRILAQSSVVYVQVSFETCWARNVARYEATHAADGDDHLTPREVMEKLYLHDDRDALLQHLEERGIPVCIVDNEAEGEEHLRAQVEALCGELFQ